MHLASHLMHTLPPLSPTPNTSLHRLHLASHLMRTLPPLSHIPNTSLHRLHLASHLMHTLVHRLTPIVIGVGGGVAVVDGSVNVDIVRAGSGLDMVGSGVSARVGVGG